MCSTVPKVFLQTLLSHSNFTTTYGHRNNWFQFTDKHVETQGFSTTMLERINTPRLHAWKIWSPGWCCGRWNLRGGALWKVLGSLRVCPLEGSSDVSFDMFLTRLLQKPRHSLCFKDASAVGVPPFTICHGIFTRAKVCILLSQLWTSGTTSWKLTHFLHDQFASAIPL